VIVLPALYSQGILVYGKTYITIIIEIIFRNSKLFFI